MKRKGCQLFKRFFIVLLSCCLMSVPELGCLRSYAVGVSAFDSLESYVDEANQDGNLESYVYSASDALLGGASGGGAVFDGLSSDGLSSDGLSSDGLSSDAPMLLAVGVDDAFFAVCKLVFAACGVLVSGDNLTSMSNDFYYFLQARAEEFSYALKYGSEVRNKTVGAVFQGLNYLIQAAKVYFGLSSSYGTSQVAYRNNEYTLTCSPSPIYSHCPAGYTHLLSFCLPGSRPGNFDLYDYYADGSPRCAWYPVSPDKYFLYSGITDEKLVPVYISTERLQYIDFLFRRSDGNSPLDIRHLISRFPFPVFRSKAACSYYLMTGEVRDVKDLWSSPYGLTITKPIVDAQQSPVTVTDADNKEYVIPESALLDEYLADVVTKEDLAAALKSIVGLQYGTAVPSESASEVPSVSVVPDPDPSESEDPVLPYFPPGFGEGVLGKLNNIGEVIKLIPDKIGEVLGKINILSDALASIEGWAQSLGNKVDRIIDPYTEDQIQKRTLKEVVLTRFPFCIPFDLIDCFRTFQATSIEPRWEIPLEIPSIGFRYVFVLDLTQFADLIELVRAITLLSYIVALVVLTRSLIKG